MTERAKLAREALAGLEAVEWGAVNGHGWSTCVDCRRLKSGVHATDCKLAAALTAARALCALLESEAGQEGDAGDRWRGIESAPKDGTTIMLWSDATRHALGYWVNAGGMWWPKEGGAWIVANGVGKATPTHWRLLPAQPSPSSESKP